MANTFAFSVEDQAMVEKIQAAMETGRPVILTYTQEVFYMPCRGDSGYFITDVKVQHEN